MMILKPAALAPLAKANSRSGVRCAETMCFSQAIAERCQGFGGVAHGLPVRLASHDDGDGGGHAVNSFGNPKT